MIQMICGSNRNCTFSLPTTPMQTVWLFIAIDADAAGAGLVSIMLNGETLMIHHAEQITYPSAWWQLATTI